MIVLVLMYEVKMLEMNKAQITISSCYLVLLHHIVLVLVLLLLSSAVRVNSQGKYVSAVGDPGMSRDSLRLAIESWNQCNEVGQEPPNMGSPRAADCFDVYKASPKQGQSSFLSIIQLVKNLLLY